MREHYDLVFEFYNRHLRRLTWIMAAVFFFGVILCGFMAFSNPEAAQQVITAFTEMMMEEGIVTDEGGISFLGILLNNWLAMLACILYGFIPFLFLPVFAIFSNAALMGFLGGWYITSGAPAAVLIAGILPHGIFELPALFLAAAMGTALCLNLVHLITKSEKAVPFVEFASDLVRTLLLVLFPLILIAAGVETYITPLIMELFL